MVFKIMSAIDKVHHATAILTFLLNKESVKKTDLLSIVSSSDSLSNSIRALQEEGFINVETKIIGRKNVFLSLTDKGHKVAKQLMMAQLAAEGKIINTFFSRQQLIIMFIGKVGKATISQIKDEILGSYDDLEDLKKIKLVKSEIDSKAYPPENYVMLTDQGEEMFRELEKAEGILKR